MLVDFALHAEREHGLSTEDAIHEACRLTLFATPVVYIYVDKLSQQLGRLGRHGIVPEAAE